MADRFYVNCPLAPGPVRVEGPEAHHLATVCRLRPGDAVCLFNGDGREYHGTVTAAGKRAVEVEIGRVEAPPREHGFRLEVAAPLPKGDRAQFLIEKLTELGVTSFVPLQTRRSVVHPREAKLDRLQRHVIESSKQCGRNVLLEVGPLTDWEEYCRSDKLPVLRLVAHPGQGDGILSAAQADRTLAVGPEGGFTDEEIALAVRHSWHCVDLGPRILRVETAALVLATLASAAEKQSGGK